MKKGFTLIEILTVIILLGVIGLIVLPTVNSMIKQSKEDLYKDQIEEIKLASEKWAFNNLDLLPDIEGKSITITLLQLKKSGYLPLDIRDPRDNKLLSNGLSIVITYKNNDYEYEIFEVITSTEITDESPAVILNGAAVMDLEINSEYIEKGAVVTDNSDNLSDIVITYYENGIEKANIDTSKLTTYTVEYSVTNIDKKLTTIITRTVIIKDSLAPTIDLPSKVTITSSEALNYDLMKDVIIKDNSGKEPNITISGFDTSVGEKIVSYQACDSSNNCSTANRIIVVE